MPGIHMPFSLHRRAPAGEAPDLTTFGVDGVAPQPPLTHDDPRLQAFLSVTFDVLYDLNVRTGAIAFGDQIDRLLGLETGEFPRSLGGWLERLHADDREAAGEAVWRSISQRSPFRLEYRLRHRDGTYRTIDDQGVVLTDERGEPTNMIGAMRDVTAERETEHAAREAQRAMQDELARSERALRRQATILDERNTALRVLLEQREQDRRELEQRIVGNVERLIDPSLDRLSRALRHHPERLEVEAVRVNLREIVGPFAERLAGGRALGPPLTRREIEVANLVRLGKTSTEIAEALHISPSSVAFHRANVRRKLGLPKGGPRLETHLAALGRD
ncbi:MAG TPA: PAS domain-containing protein [Thermoleophilia bacterium]|nr:PAS domain-containing protein [Thermoleophilia bacterium]